MKTTMKIILLAVVLLIGTRTIAQDRVYKDGSVWTVSLIKTTYGMNDEYLTNLKSTWKALHDEAFEAGFDPFLIKICRR